MNGIISKIPGGAVGVVFLVVIVGLTLLNLGILGACKAVKSQVERSPLALNLGQAKGVNIVLFKLGLAPDKISSVYGLSIPDAQASASPAAVETPAAVPAPAVPAPVAPPVPAATP